MKKMSKFRKWLIKTLGGITPDEKITPILLSEKHKKIRTFEASLTMSKFQADVDGKHVRAVLERNIFEQLMGKIDIYIVDTPNVCDIKYLAELKVVIEE